MGCQEKTLPATTKIAWPPDIPLPPPPSSASTNNNAPSNRKRLLFPDIVALEEQFADITHPDEEGQKALTLVHAIEDAVNHRVFKDKTARKSNQQNAMEGDVSPLASQQAPPADFRPLAPVSYGDFYKWAMAYIEPDPESMSAEPPKPLDLTYAITVDDTQIGSATVVTREVFGVIYTLMSHQRSRALGLSEGDMMSMSPNHNPAYAYSEVQDYSAISPWAKKFVAVAYQDGMYGKFFDLSPGKLVMTQGLAPQKPMTRGQAIVFLSWFFNQTAD